MTSAKSQVVLEVTAQGYNLAIHGIKETDGVWKCALEINEVVLDDPFNDHLARIEKDRIYEKSEYHLSFEEALNQLDDKNWFLMRPLKLHSDFAGFVRDEFEKRMQDYTDQFPAESPMDEFMRNSRIKEWRKIAGAS